MGWDPCDDRWWPEIAEALAKPWPREAVLMDLRWWASRARRGVGTRPGRPALMRRYGWTERTLRDLIASGVWEDPAQAKGPAEVQPRSSEGPAEVQESAEKSAANRARGPAKVQRRSSEGPAEVPTRVGDTEHTSPITDTGHEIEPPPPPPALPPADPDPAIDRRVEWERVHGAYLDAATNLGRKRVPVRYTSATGKALAARIRDHGVEPLIALMRWWAESPHERARFLRDNGHGLDTLTRASKCEAYLRLIAEGATAAPSARASSAEPGGLFERLQRIAAQGRPHPVIVGGDDDGYS